MGRGIVSAETLRTEQFEFEARTSDPPDAQPGEYWIRTDQTSSNPNVIAELRRQDQSGVTAAPIFAASEESNLGSDVVRGPSVVLEDGSVGFVAMTTGGGAVGSPRAVTAAGAQYVSHDGLELSIPDSGLSHHYSAKNQTDATSLVDQEGSLDMSANGSPSYLPSGINGNPAFQTDGNDDVFSSSLWSITNDSWTFAFVGSFDSVSTNFKYFFAQGDVKSGGFGFAKNGNDNYDIVISSNNATGSTADTNIHNFIVTYDGSNVILEIDGITDINQSISAPSPSGSASIGGDINQSLYRALTFGEFLIYDTFSDSQKRTDINQYLNNEWGT